MGGQLWLCVGLLALFLQVGSCLNRCRVGYSLCKDGSECIPYSHVCDGEEDCKDGSDEQNCEVGCSADQFQCAHGKKCIDKDQVCDGVPQCQDRSDEQQCLKHPEDCAHRCDKSHCLPASFICDGEKDCLDGTDEANCEDKGEAGTIAGPTSAPSSQSRPLRCGLGSQMCKDKSDCVHYNYLCDGEPDCRDGSDEEDCISECGNDQFQCAHGRKCIERTQVCDGVPQCQDRSDELGCAKRMEGCAHLCDENSRCVPSSFLCDGERDCSDGSDEATCADVQCSSTEFKCLSGQCVLASMHCDGHPDCLDRSDEDGCTKPPVCTTKHHCPHSKECLVQEWLCDGDQDCKDGSDEKDCPVMPVSCGAFQWPCKSKTQCIPTVWRCDRIKDCDNGSDEMECGVGTCLPHEFQCGSQECLDPVLVCNGIANCADGSDEGGSCQMACTAADRCTQSCRSTPQGPRCQCTAGYRLLEDGQTCADVDECDNQVQSVCSHLCINAPGSYQCECHPGFIMEADGYQCKITGEPFMLASVQTELYMYGLRSGSLDVLSSSAKKAILSVDYDWRDQKVFWVGVETETIRWSSMNQKTTGIFTKGVRADSVAVDWLARNLYWIDGVNSQIVAVSLAKVSVKSLDQSIILEEDLDQPRSLALLPQKGLMFWTEIGNLAKIERAGMDGSERRAVVNSSLGWPGGIAVDDLSERVFWTDEQLNAIGSSTLDGDNVKMFQLKETTNPFSVAVFNDLLYWSDAKKRVVQAINKLSGKNRQVILKRPGQPFAIKIVHPITQMDTESPCKKMACSHMCVLAPRRKAVCKCPSGLSLAEDGLLCSSLPKSTSLLLLTPPTVTKIYFQAQQATELKDWPKHLAIPIPGISDATIMDYSAHDDTLVLTDASATSVTSFKLTGSVIAAQEQILKLLDDQITAIALDWVTLNIYWSSSKQSRLQVTSKTGAYTAILIKDGIAGVGSIALHPESGQVCFTNLNLKDAGSKATVECAYMDGGERKVVWKDAVQPASLVFSSTGDTIYWANTGMGKISLVKTDGSGYEELEAGDGLTAVALGDMPIWMTVSDMTRLWYREDQQQKLWFEVSTKVLGLKAHSQLTQSGSNQCAANNGDCQHLCLATPKGRTCKCAHDFNAKDTNCSPDQTCSDGARKCLAQTCLPAEKFCDGHADCADHSDENCAGAKQKLGTKVSTPNQSTPPPHTPSPKTNLGNAVEENSGLQNLEAEECSQNRCSGKGHCVKINGVATCKCKEGYSGVSCQDIAAKGVQDLIIYGAAGLCGIIVVIAVIAVVFKNAASRGGSPDATMETSMSELEKKAGAAIGTQNAQATSEKQEEPVSSVD